MRKTMRRKAIKPEHKIDLVLDELDRNILYHWDLNARQSASEIARKAGSNKDTVNFRMNRLVEEGIVTSFVTELDGAKLGQNIIKVYFQFKDFNKKVEKEFFDYLKTIKEAAWVVSCSGRWDALVAFWSTSSFHFHSYFIQILNRFSRHILHKDIIHNINWHYYNRKWLKKQYTTPLAMKYGGEPGDYRLDKLDRGILLRLVRNAREPVVNIAKETGQSSQNVINRIKKLEKDGIIRKYSLAIDYRKIGYVFCKTFVHLRNITKERLDELHTYCASQPNIFAITTALGTWDYEIEFEVPNFEEMTEIMDSIRMKFSDIISNYESIIITKQSALNYIVE